jgi:hypothetical protein
LPKTPFLLSICTGILGIFYILQFEISSLMNWIFSKFENKLDIFTISTWIFFPKGYGAAKKAARS